MLFKNEKNLRFRVKDFYGKVNFDFYRATIFNNSPL